MTFTCPDTSPSGDRAATTPSRTSAGTCIGPRMAPTWPTDTRSKSMTSETARDVEAVLAEVLAEHRAARRVLVGDEWIWECASRECPWIDARLDAGLEAYRTHVAAEQVAALRATLADLESLAAELHQRARHQTALAEAEVGIEQARMNGKAAGLTVGGNLAAGLAERLRAGEVVVP